MHVSASEHCEKTILFAVSILAKDQKSVSFAMLKGEKAGVFQAPQAMFQEVRKSLGC